MQQDTSTSALARSLPSEVLIVEDSPTDQRLLRESLVELGVTVSGIHCAATLREARQVLATRSVGCILLDLSLPDASGLEGVAVLATAAPDTPIVVVTSRPAADSLVYAALAEGAEEYVTKSDVGGDPLARAIGRAVERRRGVTRARRTELVAGRVLDLIEAPTAALDGSGQIIATNQAWSEVSRRCGAATSSTGAGVNYLAMCDMAAGVDSDGASEAAAGIRTVLFGDAERFLMDYPCWDRWFSVRVTPLGEHGGGAIVTHLDISQLKSAELHLRRNGAHIETVFDEATSIFALVDEHGMCRHVSEETGHLLGWDGGARVGSDAFERIDRVDVARAMAVFARVLALPEGRERVQVGVIDGDGRRRRLDLNVSNQLHDPNVAAIVISGADITASHRAQITRRLESRLLAQLPASVILTDDRGVVVYWNDRATSIFGHAAEDAVGRTIAQLGLGPIDADDAKRSSEEFALHGRWEGEYDARRADGSVVPVYVTLEPLVDDDISFHGMVGAAVEISDRRKLEADLVFQAMRDRLTGLPNRHMFVDQLEGAVGRSARRRNVTAVLYLDLDDFSAVNDALGHAMGDEVLRTVGDLVSGVVREGDMVARLGGDEFVVCCEDIGDVAEAYAVADRMLQVLSIPFRFGDQSIVITASIGVALSGSTRGGEAVLRNADAAMHRAKEGGRGCIELFDDAGQAQGRARRVVAQELEAGIGNGELVTYFQPEVELATGALFGFEALVRWQHPVRGLLAPGEFIDIAEERGLVGDIGALVLRDACRALARWSALVPDRPLTVSVNVSAHQLTDPGLPKLVSSVIAEAGVDAARICLELTESTLMEAPAVAQALRALHQTGVRIAIDDFGTGYSSLSRLRGFPVDFLKIDRSFVNGLGRDHDDGVIVAAVINLGRSLGLKLIAEGIEDAEQLRLLGELGCDYGQGFLWARALPLAQADELVRGSHLEALPTPTHLERHA